VASSLTAALREGRVALEAGSASAAIRHFQAATNQDPKAPLPWVLLAEAFYRDDQVREATAAATRAIQLDETATPAWVRLGVVGLRLGDYEEGARNFERALAIDPTVAEDWHQRFRSGRPAGEIPPHLVKQGVKPATSELALAGLGRDLCVNTRAGEAEIQARRRLENNLPPLWDVGHFIRNRYEVLAVRRGGMSFVHIAFDHLQGRPYAVKRLRQDLLDTPGVQQTFLREAELWVSLERHPHIVEADFVQIIDDQPAIFLEYIDGGSMSGLLRERPLSIPKAVEIALQVAEALQHAHLRAKIIHRDVKPSNVLLTRDLLAKVTDFGLARAVGTGEPGQDATDGRIFGTPQYMAPEAFSHANEIDVRADVYSFGCTLYEMLTRQLPFQGATALELKAKHEREPVPDPRAINSAIRPELAEIVQCCMAKDPRARYRGFVEVSAALAEVYRAMTGRERERAAPRAQLNAAHWVAKGASLLQLGKHEEALEAFDRATQLDQELPQAWTGKASALRALERHREALVACYRALSRDPRSAAALNTRGLSFAALGEHERAIEDFEQATRLAPEQLEAWHNKGLSLEALKRYDEAVACYDRALEIDPTTARSWLSKALCLLAQSKAQEAAEACDRLLALEPESAAAWKVKGAALAAAEQWEGAVAAYGRASGIDPEDEFTRQAAEEARAKMAAPKPAPTPPSHSTFDRGLRRMHRGRLEEAAAEFARAAEEDPASERAWRHLSGVYFQLGRYAEAEAPARKSVELAPDDPAVYCNLGVILRKQEKWAEARDVLLRALRLDPNYLKARIELDKVNQRDPGAVDRHSRSQS
jgi:tetratricopeptide (TPR) repeat protein